MKPSIKKGIIITSVCAFTLVGIKFYLSSSNTVEVHSVSSLNTGYWDNPATSTGLVSNSDTQSVLYDSSKTITQVFVKEGQQVSVGPEKGPKEDVNAWKEERIKKTSDNTCWYWIEYTYTDGSNNAYDSKDVVEYYSDKQKVPYEDISTVGTKKNPYVFKLSEDQGFVYGKLFLDNKNLNSYFRFDVYTNDDEISSSWLVRCDKFATKQSMNEGDMYSVISHTKEEQKYIGTEQNQSPDNTSGYTEIELAKAIRDKKQELKTLDLDLRKAKLSLSENKALLNDGIVRAKRSGIVRNIKDLSNPIQDGSAFLEVATGQGTYIKGSISELMLNQIKVGDTISAYCWTSGETFDAKIQSIDTVPSSSSNYNGSGNPNVSYYGFEAYAKDASKIQAGEYLELTFNLSSDTTSSIWLSKAYVKQEGNKYYVLKDVHGKLKKQYVTVGKIVWGDTMEIKDGLSDTDYIAFAYSKNAKEGVKTQKSLEATS